MYVMTMCGLMDGGSFLLPFPITFWCNSIHCRVSIVTRHGMLTLAQGIEVDNWLCIWSAPTFTSAGAWQGKLAYVTMCGLITFASRLRPFSIGFWCNSIHCQVIGVTRHGNLAPAQGSKVDI